MTDNGSRYSEEFERLGDPAVELVIRDVSGDAWLHIGPDKWASIADVMRGKKYAEQYASTREEIEEFGPFTVEWSMEVAR